LAKIAVIFTAKSHHMKKYILSISIFLVLLLGSALFLPYLFKDKIIEAVRKEANKSLKAELRFNPNIGINIFKSFPNLNISFKELALIYPDSTFQNDTLIYADKLEVSFDLMKFYKVQQYIFKSISITKPFIHLESKNDSTVNWDVMREDDTTASEVLNFELAIFEIEHGSFDYVDTQSDIIFKLRDFNHYSSGNFNTDKFTLAAKSDIAEMIMSYEGVTYLNQWSLKQEGDIEVDMTNGKYTLPQNTLVINGLVADLDGSIALAGDDILFDLKTSSSSPDLNKFLTLIPAIYASDFSSMKTKGAAKMAFSFIGKYNDVSFPAYDLKLGVTNGWFKYPDLPMPAEDINLDLHVFSKDGNTDKTVIDIPKLHFKMANDPFDVRLNMQDIFGNTLIDTDVKGKLNLTNVTKIVPLENTKLSGDLVSDVSIKGRINDIQSSAIDKFKASGNVETHKLVYQTPVMNEVLMVNNAQINLSNQKINIPAFDGTLGKNDINFTGSFDNFFGYLLDDKTLSGSGILTSKRLNANDFITDDGAATETEMTLVEIPGNVDLDLTTSIDQLIYDDLTLNEFTGRFTVVNKALNMKNVSTGLLGGRLGLEGAYQYDVERPFANFDVSYSNIKVADLLAKFKVIKAFAPLASQVNAMTTAKLSFSSLLNNDMSPKLDAVNLGGSLNLENVVVDKLEVLKGIDSKLGTNHLNVSKLRDFLLKFNIKDGKLIVSPFDMFIDSSKLSLEGVSKIDGSIDYKGFLSIPSSYVKNETAIINGLTKGTAFSNLQLSPKDFLDIAINIGGTFKKPEIKLNLKEIKNNFKQTIKTTVLNEVDKKKDEAKTAVTDEVNKMKDDAQKKADEAKAKLQAELDAKKKEADAKLRQEAEDKKKKLQEEAEKKLKGLFKK
jgi:hypothetical protein